MQHRPLLPFIALAVLLALPGAAQAQDRDVYKLPEPTVPPGAVLGRALPGVASSSPIGFGPSRRDLFVGVGYQNSTGFGGDPDGALSFGAGFLSPSETVGIEAVITSVSTVRSGFGSRLVGGLKAHKLLADNLGVGVGVEGIPLNGDEFDTKQSFYVAATQVRTIADRAYFNQATLNLGVGNGRFQKYEAFRDGENGVGVFASAAIRVTDISSAIVDYTGQQWNMALSFTPLKAVPAVVTASINDLCGSAGDAARLALAVGFSWKY